MVPYLVGTCVVSRLQKWVNPGFYKSVFSLQSGAHQAHFKPVLRIAKCVISQPINPWMDKCIVLIVLLAEVPDIWDPKIVDPVVVSLLILVVQWTLQNSGSVPNFFFLPEFCGAGSFSRDGLAPCTTCRVGYFQPQTKSRSCQKCPDDTATWRRGAKNSQECQCKVTHKSFFIYIRRL